MNGIFGILNLKGAPVSKDNIERMKNSLIHRGPDGSGIWIDGEVGVGHLKMHITPESVYENLPSLSPEKDRVITADARLDNRSELFHLLSIPVKVRDKMPDSLLILKAYDKWGETCPTYLVGEFSFAIWDRRERTLFCARDHMGFKPFYYYRSSDYFIFATEIKGIRSLPFIPTLINEDAIARSLLPPDPQHDHSYTYFKDIMRLSMGHWIKAKLTCNRDTIQSRCYWNPESSGCLRYSSDGEYAEALRELVVDAVHCRMRTLPHLSIGATLSGGLDSSAVACIAARKLKAEGKRLLAVSSVLPIDHKGNELDEREYINLVLEQEQNIDIQYVTAQNVGPFDDLETFFTQSESQVNCFNYMDHALRNTARGRNVSLLFTGLGGDHMASYPGRDSLYRLTREFKWLKALRLTRQLSIVQNQSLYNIIKSKIVFPYLPLWTWNLYRAFKNETIPGLEMDFSPANYNFAKKNGYSPNIYNKINRNLTTDYCRHIASKIRVGRFVIEPENIRYSYLGMTGLFPLFDKRITEFFMAVPPEQFLIGGWHRSLFRRAMEGILPPAIQWRKDKRAYTPDFHRRVKSTEKKMLEFLNTIKKDDFVCRYIDIERIKTQFNNIDNYMKTGAWEARTQTIVLKGIVLIKFLHWIASEQKKRL